jgi:hypothetical protein
MPLEDALSSKEEIQQSLATPYRAALKGHGIGPELLARKRKQQIKAKSVKHIKIKGFIPEGVKFPPGYKVISNGGATELAEGRMIFDEALIEYQGNDWGIQTKATESLEKILGLHTEKIDLNLSGVVQAQLTDFPPEPKTIEEWEERYRKYQAQKDGVGDAPPNPDSNTTATPGG